MIKVINEPKVYLIARPALVYNSVDEIEGLEAFYEAIGVPEFTSDACSDGEELIEIAGRLCYMSYKNPRPGGNATYLKHIREVGHGCYDGETTVLTLAGWKKWPEVTMDDQFATLNLKDNNIEYHKPKRLVRYFHDGRMYRVKGQQVDLLVTPDHKMVACVNRRKNDYNLVSASELGTRSFYCVKNASWDNFGWPGCPPKEVFALLGFAIGDGSISPNNRKVISFHLKRQRKINWLRKLCEKIKPLGFLLRENVEKNKYYVRLPNDEKILELFGNIYDKKREKQIPLTDLLFGKTNKDCLVSLFDGLIESDGNKNKRNTFCSFDTTSPNLPGQLQQLCLHIGLAANICYVYDKDKRKSSFGKKPLTRLCVVSKCLKPLINKYKDTLCKSYWVDNWQGEVFCAEVPNNTLYVQRNGRPVWSGNSVTEHSNWSFLLTGVSRSLTHELVRHRAGWAYSQLSQRYVDESDCEFVVPDCIKEDESLYTEWLKTVEICKDAYKKLTDGLAKKFESVADKTLRRKMARQAARSVLPNATETKIVVTANARAIRHFLEMRGSKHAEDEIRKLAIKMMGVMQHEAPNLFGDYSLVEFEPGKHEIYTQYRKV
jgi:thymidylate synthase (FAD)